MARLNRGRLPPTDNGQGGWHYPVAEHVILRGQTEEILTKQIFEYRLRNNLPIGDIERDIDAYYCNRWPQACHLEAKDTDGQPKPAQRRTSLIERIALWASTAFRTMPKGGYELESTPEAIRRAQACLGCPKNVSWRSGCSSCNASTNKLLLELRKLRKTPHDGNLLACDVIGADNQSSVHLPISATPITEEQRSQLPSHCWRKPL